MYDDISGYDVQTTNTNAHIFHSHGKNVVIITAMKPSFGQKKMLKLPIDNCGQDSCDTLQLMANSYPSFFNFPTTYPPYSWQNCLSGWTSWNIAFQTEGIYS